MSAIIEAKKIEALTKPISATVTVTVIVTATVSLSVSVTRIVGSRVVYD